MTSRGKGQISVCSSRACCSPTVTVLSFRSMITPRVTNDMPDFHDQKALQCLRCFDFAFGQCKGGLLPTQSTLIDVDWLPRIRATRCETAMGSSCPLSMAEIFAIFGTNTQNKHTQRNNLHLKFISMLSYIYYQCTSTANLWISLFVWKEIDKKHMTPHFLTFWQLAIYQFVFTKSIDYFF